MGNSSTISVLARAAWAAWTKVARVIADFQARVFLTVMYFVVLAPFAAITAVKARRRRAPGFWLLRKRPALSLEDARRQF